jgi:hypothetical protein
MVLNASIFTSTRTNSYALTNKRVKQIMLFTHNCYEKIIADKVAIDYSKKGTIKQEDYFKNRLVKDFMEPNLHHLNNGTSSYSIANTESTEEYIDFLDKKLHVDPIDIQFIDKGLQNSWGNNTKTYLAIECKRITKLSDTQDYVTDTLKFCDRDYSATRIPFEGQIAFIENHSLTPQMVSIEINNKLSTNLGINTIKHLSLSTSGVTYNSIHRKNYSPNPKFWVYHLLWECSSIIIN